MKNQLSPLEAYRNLLSAGDYTADPAQAYAIEQLNCLYQELNRSAIKKCLLAPIFPWQGIYLYGSVGAGKTWLMDLFYDSLPQKKLRYHFHQFMRYVHERLAELQGKKNPLKLIAQSLAEQAHIICFDELFVNDIGDAMLLGELFHFIFSENIYLVCTSNRLPQDLYYNGLQRDRFYPAIHLLEKKLKIIEVVSLHDYRFRDVISSGSYLTPLNDFTKKQIKKMFDDLTTSKKPGAKEILVNDRVVFCQSQLDSIVWFTFDQICTVPRSVQDYVVLTKKFKIFLLDEVPDLSDENMNATWYLISFVDVLYDAKCKLIIRAAVDLAHLYSGETWKYEFERCFSRLQEMQTKNYWMQENELSRLSK